MRIAYFGYDRSCLKTWNELSRQGFDVVYFLIEVQQDLKFSTFDKTFIFSNDVMIPFKEQDRTGKQKQQFAHVEKNFHSLQQRICARKIAESGDQRAENTRPPTVLPLTEIMDIHYNAKKKKVVVEIERKGIEAFEFILTESHPLVSIYFDTKRIQLFKATSQTDYIWSSLRFEYQPLKPVAALQQDSPFFLVLDPERDSIIDNWFYCVIKAGLLELWTFQPFNQINNPEFQNFYIDRIRAAVASRFSFLQLQNYLNTELSTVGSPDVHRQLILSSALVMPNVSFWNGLQIENFLKNYLYKITRKVRKNNEASV